MPSALTLLRVLGLCVILLAAPAVSGMDASDVLLYRKGPLVLRPQLSISEQFNDNIFYQSSGGESDFISILSPGLQLLLGREDHNHLQLTYTFDRLMYLDQSHLNANQHHVEARSRFEFGKFTLEGTDSIHFLSSPLGGAQSATLRDQKVDRTSFFDNYTLTHFVSPKTRVYIEGTHSNNDYKEGVRLYDLRSLSGNLGFGYSPTRRFFIFGEGLYGHSMISANFPAPDPPQSDFYGGFIGARGNFTPKISGFAKIGYEVRQFEDETPAPSSPAADISLTYRMSDRTSITGSYARRSNISVQFARQSYLSDVVALQLGQVIGTTGKLVGTAGGSYSLSEYEVTGATTSVRTDNWWRIHATLTYNIQLWLRTSLGYEFESFRSDIPNIDFDYDVNRVTLRVAVGY